MIRIAIIGTGSIAAVHLQAFTMFADRCTVVALADNKEERANVLRDRFRLESRFVQDYRELLNDEEVDMVSICTPLIPMRRLLPTSCGLASMCWWRSLWHCRLKSATACWLRRLNRAVSCPSSDRTVSWIPTGD